GLAPPLKGPSAAVSQQAHFTALDGTIRVRKGNGNSWINADYNVPLEKGDVVQTGAEGMAKIVFNDGTNYTVKQDSLIVIEENSANDQQQTSVSVAVSTGTVDLTTATYVQGSKSQVIVAGAKASLAPDSAAMVHNNPKDDQHEILVKKGSGEVERNGEMAHLSPWEKVSFRSESEGSRVRLDAHGERSRIPAAHFAQSVFFVVIARPQGGDAKCGGDRPARRRLLLVDPVLRLGGQGIGGKRKESLYYHCQGQGKNRAVARNRAPDPTRTRD